MILSRVDFPAPFAPSTPILAPGKNDRETLSSTTLSGGCVLRRRYMVKMYSSATTLQRNEPASGEVAASQARYPRCRQRN